MIVILDNYNDEDVQIISTHLYRRQLHLFVKDKNTYIGIEIETPFDFNFISNFLHCRLLLTPSCFLHNGKRYTTMTLVKEDEETVNLPTPDINIANDIKKETKEGGCDVKENTDSGDGVLS